MPQQGRRDWRSEKIYPKDTPTWPNRRQVANCLFWGTIALGSSMITWEILDKTSAQSIKTGPDMPTSHRRSTEMPHSEQQKANGDTSRMADTAVQQLIGDARTQIVPSVGGAAIICEGMLGTTGGTPAGWFKIQATCGTIVNKVSGKSEFVPGTVSSYSLHAEETVQTDGHAVSRITHDTITRDSDGVNWQISHNALTLNTRDNPNIATLDTALNAVQRDVLYVLEP